MVDQPTGQSAAKIAALEQTQDLNVAGTTSLVSPDDLADQLSMTSVANQTVVESRRAVEAILKGQDSRFLVLVGPCSIHDVDAALDYAKRLAALRHELEDRLFIVMRVYFEKPRTTIGWKGLINDPHLNGTFDLAEGLRLARKLLLDINGLGLGAGTEMLEPITPQYIADLVSWASIGARTIESQTHRQMASGLSMPVGYKNTTDGNLQIALDAFKSAQNPHHFLGIDHSGRSCIIATKGNMVGHVILRGGFDRPNYDPATVADAATRLEEAELPPYLVVDCSHANSGKQHEQQEVVWNNVIQQRASGNTHLVGAMLESNIHEGSQKLSSDRSELQYGVSVTDACIGWEKTEQLLREAHEKLG